MRKVFVFDLDGTILNSKNHFPKEIANIIRSILSKGDKVVFATGRMHISAKKLLESVFDGEDIFPIISYNGAVVYIPNKGFVFEKTLDIGAAHKAIDFFREANIHIQSYVEDILYSEKDNDEIKLYSKHAGVPYVIVQDLKSIEKPPIKMLSIGEASVIDNFIDPLKKLIGEKANIFKSFSIFLDIVPTDANKGIALKFLSDYLGFELKDTIVFGDNENDLFMFEVAGMKIAVENAVEKLKEVADFVTKSNDENGVFFAFTQFFPEYLF